MPLRATAGPKLARTSARVGEPVEVSAKVENSTASPETVRLVVEGLAEGPLAKPVDLAVVFEPAAVELRPKSRASLAFTWRAALPPGKDAFTLRGRLVLRTTLGRLVGEAPLDLYVSS